MYISRLPLLLWGGTVIMVDNALPSQQSNTLNNKISTGINKKYLQLSTAVPQVQLFTSMIMGGRVDHTSNKAFAIWPMIHQGSVCPFFSWNLGPSTKNPTHSEFPGFLAKKSGTVERNRKSMWIMPTAGSKTLGFLFIKIDRLRITDDDGERQQNVGESLRIRGLRSRICCGEKNPRFQGKNPRCINYDTASSTVILRTFSLIFIPWFGHVKPLPSGNM